MQAYWRSARLNNPELDALPDFGELLGGLWDIQPGDRERVAALWLRCPNDLKATIKIG